MTLEGAGGYREGAESGQAFAHGSEEPWMERGKEQAREGCKGKCDEGFTTAVMFAGSRNFGVSEPGVEPYLNEPG